MNILLSIHHNYAKEIMNGTKLFEYRKMNFKYPIHLVYLYESSPVKKITCVFECTHVYHVNPSYAWKMTHSVAGISKKDYFSYYSNARSATLIEVGKVRYLKHPLSLNDFGFKSAPMSFRYLK